MKGCCHTGSNGLPGLGGPNASHRDAPAATARLRDRIAVAARKARRARLRRPNVRAAMPNAPAVSPLRFFAAGGTGSSSKSALMAARNCRTIERAALVRFLLRSAVSPTAKLGSVSLAFALALPVHAPRLLLRLPLGG